MIKSVSKLNEYSQKLKVIQPCYEFVTKEGKDHCPIFYVKCRFSDQEKVGEGSSIKAAKESAAKKMADLLDVDSKLKQMNRSVTYSIVSYDAPLISIWENDHEEHEYTLTLQKKDNIHNKIEQKKFKVQIHPVW